MPLNSRTTIFPACLAAFICIAAAFSSIAQTKADLTKVEKIKAIISRTRQLDIARDTFEKNIPMIMNAYKQNNPNLTSNQTEEIITVIRKSIIDLGPSFERMVIGVYDDQMNNEQVDALYDFYSTPIGSQIAEKQQYMIKFSGLQAGTWGRSILAPEIKKRLQADDALKGLNFR